jgi:hypothetical protein
MRSTYPSFAKDRMQQHINARAGGLYLDIGPAKVSLATWIAGGPGTVNGPVMTASPRRRFLAPP